MSDVVLGLGQVWLLILIAAAMFVVVKGSTATRRVLALEMASFLLLALLVVFAIDRSSSYYLDAALVLGLLGFLGTQRLARHLIEEGSQS